MGLIEAHQVIEHLTDLANTIKELHRILKDRGKLIIDVPYFMGRDTWSHPQHKRGFTTETFDFFVKGTKRHQSDGRCFDFSFSERKIKLIYGKGLHIEHYFVEPLFNLNPYFYENTILRFLFPADGISVELTK